MITGELKSRIDKVWEAIWAGGISNPLTAIEQITYLLFIKRLDEIQSLKELKATRTGKPIESPLYTKTQNHLRWSQFKNLEAQKMFDLMTMPETKKDIGIFAFIKKLGSSSDSVFSRYMKDATFMISTPKLLERVVSMINDIPMEDRDTKGDLYEYLLSKLSSAGTNGQFRTPRHIIKMMVELMEPKPDDVICDPACGTGGFLVASAEYLTSPEREFQILHDKKMKDHFLTKMFYGNDFDSSMIRIAAMNMMLHGMENPNIESLDSLSEDCSSVENKYTLILANPPFKGSIDKDSIASNLKSVVKTEKTELLFLALILRELKIGGRCAVIVPDGVLFGSSNAHVAIRKEIIENHKLQAVISMPSGVFKPYAGVSTGILILDKTTVGGTDNIWFYDMESDGFSLDDKRNPISENDIPDILSKYKDYKAGKGKFKDKKAKAFIVAKTELTKDYDLSINKYRLVVHQMKSHDKPSDILNRLKKTENEIAAHIRDLEALI